MVLQSEQTVQLLKKLPHIPLQYLYHRNNYYSSRSLVTFTSMWFYTILSLNNLYYSQNMEIIKTISSQAWFINSIINSYEENNWYAAPMF